MLSGKFYRRNESSNQDWSSVGISHAHGIRIDLRNLPILALD